MQNKVKKALIGYFTHGANGRRKLPKPPVGITVQEAGIRYTISLTFTFKAGSRYSSIVPADMFHPDWNELRARLQEEGVEVAHPLRIQLQCVFERGAMFAVNSGIDDSPYRPIDEGPDVSYTVDELEGWNSDNTRSPLKGFSQ